MRDLIYEFLKSGSMEAFWTLRERVLESAEYQPGSTLMAEIWSEFEDQGPVSEERCRQLFPNFLVSPTAHLMLAKMHKAREDERSFQMELRFFEMLLEALMATGKGTPDEPYRVTRVDDEISLCRALQADITDLECRWVDGRLHDILKTPQGALHFRVDDVLQGYP